MTVEGTAAHDDRTISATFKVPVDALIGRRADTTTPSDELHRETGRQLDDIHFQLLTCRLDELHPHPSYARHHLSVSACQLSALAALGDFAFREPIAITRDRTIIDGYTRWKLAQQQGQTTLP